MLCSIASRKQIDESKPCASISRVYLVAVSEGVVVTEFEEMLSISLFHFVNVNREKLFVAK